MFAKLWCPGARSGRVFPTQPSTSGASISDWFQRTASQTTIVCTSPTVENADHSKSVESRSWRVMRTEKDARGFYIQSGLLPPNCPAGVLMLQVFLEDPVRVRYFGSYVKGLKERCMFELLLCWSHILVFRQIDEKCIEFQLSKAQSIMKDYVEDEAIFPRALLPMDEIDRINSTLHVVIHSSTKYGNSLSKDFFKDIYFKCLCRMHAKLFVPFMQTKDYVNALAESKRGYNQLSVNDFEYMEELGRGAFGCVVRCRKKSTGKLYAMKIQTKDGLIETCSDHPDRVMTERDALASCHHPFIVSMDYALQSQELVLMAMELMTEGSLMDALHCSPDGCLSPGRVKFYAAEIILALSHIHKRDMIYRDLKPSNVLLGADGHIKLADLGGVIDLKRKIIGYQDELAEIGEALFAPGGNNDLSETEFLRSLRVVHTSDGDRDGPQLIAKLNAEMNNSVNSGFALSKNTGSYHSDVPPMRQNSQSISMKKSHFPADDPIASYGGGNGSGNGSASQNKGKRSQSSNNINNNVNNNAKYKMATISKAETLHNLGRKVDTSVYGTTGYMAPEMAAMVSDETRECLGYTSAVDYYSLGVTMYELAAGNLPTKAKYNADTTESETAATGETCSIAFPARLKNSLGFTDLILKLINDNPEMRLGSGSKGTQDVRSHVFFNSIDWIAVAQKHVNAPAFHKANLSKDSLNENVVANDDFNDMIISLGKKCWVDNCGMDENEQKLFSNWDFISPCAVQLEIGHQASCDQEIATANSRSSSIFTSLSRGISSLLGKDSKSKSTSASTKLLFSSTSFQGPSSNFSNLASSSVESQNDEGPTTINANAILSQIDN